MMLLWSPVGGQNTTPAPHEGYAVAFASVAPLNTDIFIAAGDGSDARPLLAHPELDYNASFSPDGRSIVFTSTRNGSADIYRVGIDGAGLRRVTDDRAFDDQGVLSPHGTSLAFVSSRSGQADIWILELATGALRNVTNHPGGDFRPSWSPDGQWIAFSSDRDSKKPKFAFATLQTTDIYLARTEEKWSPQGDRIASGVGRFFQGLLGSSTANIAVISVDGKEVRILTDGSANYGFPSWSPDGSQLVFRLGGKERNGLVIANVATGTLKTLTAGVAHDNFPSW